MLFPYVRHVRVRLARTLSLAWRTYVADAHMSYVY